MVKKESIKKKKDDPYLIYKILVKYLMSPTADLLNKLCENKEQADKLKNRALIHLEAFPNIIHDINSYLNNKYSSILASFTNEQWFECFASFIKKINLSSSRLLYYAKYNINPYSEFSKKLKKYTAQIDGDPPSSQEIQSLYILFTLGIIPNDIFDELLIDNDSEIKNSKTPKVKNEDILNSLNFTKNISSVTSKNRTYDNLNANVQEYINVCLKFIKNGHKGCRYCQLNQNDKIVLDTNAESISSETPIDILFIGQHSYDDDIENKLPMSGKTSSVIRDILDLLLSKYPKLKYGCVNQLICTIPNTKYVGDKEFKPDKCIQNCKIIVDVIINNLNPKLIVLIGEKVGKSLIKNITKSSIGTLINDKIIIIPSINSLNNVKSKSLLEKCIQLMCDILDKTQIEKIINNSDSEINSDFSIPPHLIVNKLTEAYTILDCKRLKNKLVYLLKDSNNVKRYYFEDFKMPVYIKFGNYKDCNYFTSEVDAIAYLSSTELEQLNRKLQSNKTYLTRY